MLHSEWRPLSFGNQGGTPVIWFEAEKESALEQRVIYLQMTGEPVPPKTKYVGTATFGPGGAIAIHCYVEQQAEAHELWYLWYDDYGKGTGFITQGNEHTIIVDDIPFAKANAIVQAHNDALKETT